MGIQIFQCLPPLKIVVLFLVWSVFILNPSDPSQEFLSEALSRELFPSAQQLISDYHDFVLPLIQAGNISAAREYVYGPLKDQFLAHRTAVKNLISLSNRELTRAKSSSQYVLKSKCCLRHAISSCYPICICFLPSCRNFSITF